MSELTRQGGMMKEIILEDGKYRFYEENYTLKCDRHGERWRDFSGDKAIFALFDHALQLEIDLEEAIQEDSCYDPEDY